MNEISPRAMSTDENSVLMNNRKPLKVIEQNTLKSRRQSSVGFDADNCSKRLKVLLQEKEKHLTFLEKELSVSQSKVEELQVSSERHKRNEREAKKILATHESSLKRQTVTLKYTNDRLHALVRKEDDKIRRSGMERKELEDELERTEEEYEEQIANITESNRAECSILEDLLSSLKFQQSTQLKAQSDGFDMSTIDLANQYTSDISAFKESMAVIEAQSKDLLDENKQLQCVAKEAKLKYKLQSREISDFVSFNEKTSVQLKRQTTEMELAIEKNARLQCFIDNLLFDKRSAERAEIDKDTKVDNLMRLLDEKNRILTEANAEKCHALKFASAEVVRLSQEDELRTRSFTELWSSKVEGDLSENILKTQIQKLNSNLSSAHEEINSNISKIDRSNEMNIKLKDDVSMSNRRNAELEQTVCSLEAKLLASQAELNIVTVAHCELNSCHVIVSSHLIEERMAKKSLEDQLKKEQDTWSINVKEHQEALQKEEIKADILIKSLEEKKTELMSLELNLNVLDEELIASHLNVEKLSVQKENDKNILEAFKLRLKDMKCSSLDAIKNYNAINEQLSDVTASYAQQLAAAHRDISTHLSLLDAADKMKIRLQEEIGEFNFDL